MVRPLVSIYMPTCGRPGLLRRALDSVVAQTHRPLEVVVCVDGPDADSVAQARGYTGRGGLQVRVLPRPESGGACVARNAAIAAARGDYITGLDDDDEMLPDRVAALLEAYRAHRPAFVCSNYLRQWPHRTVTRSKPPGPVTLRRLLWSNVVGNQVLTETARLRAIGGFDASFPSWQDFDTWFRLAQRFGDGYRAPSISYVHHRHPGERITAPLRAIAGFRQFLWRHALQLDDCHRRSLRLAVHETTGLPLRLSELHEFLDPRLATRVTGLLRQGRVAASGHERSWVALRDAEQSAAASAREPRQGAGAAPACPEPGGSSTT